MAETDPNCKAHAAIGRYFYAFSTLERELGESLKVVLRLQENPAADATVGAVGDFARKANIVREAIQGAKNADGSAPTNEWKERADKTIREILGCNRPDRVDLAHDYLEPGPDGSLGLQKPGQNPRAWTSQDFDSKIKKLQDLAVGLTNVRTDLTTLRIPVPTGWMFQEPMMMRREPNPALYASFSASVPRPPES